jgi:hypothetical protein
VKVSEIEIEEKKEKSEPKVEEECCGEKYPEAATELGRIRAQS